MKILKVGCNFIFVFLFAAISHAGDQGSLTPFSAHEPSRRLPGSWEEYRFQSISKPTKYRLIKDENGVTVLEAKSRGSASALVHLIDRDPREFSQLKWRWKVDSLTPGMDLRTKVGDDHPVRIYAVFSQQAETGREVKSIQDLLEDDSWELRVLNYVWAKEAALEAITPSPYTSDFMKVVVETGERHLGNWREYTRDLTADFRKAFQEEPVRLMAVMVMTDTDNTGFQAVGHYGDISISYYKLNTYKAF